MEHHPNSSPITDPNRFGERVYITARNLARSRFEKGTDAGAHDMAMLVFLQFWANPQRWMATYTAERFAAVALSNRAEDWRRSERIQRGQGAHLAVRDGARVSRRQVDSLDELTERTGEVTRNGADIADAVADTVLLHDALALLTELQRTLVWAVEVHGYSVVEMARSLELSRPYCQRELGKARRFIHDFVVAA